jgi:hypothetical protein
MRKYLDKWSFWAVVSWVVLAILVFWLFKLNEKVDNNINSVEKVTKANTDAIAFLCDTNAIVQALANQTVALLRSQPHTAAREATIDVFEGYAHILAERLPCVKAEKASTTG